MAFPVITWFLSSYHVHWSVEGRITQTTPFNSYQIEPILAPHHLSLHLHAHIRNVSGGLKADPSATPPFFSIGAFFSDFCLLLCAHGSFIAIASKSTEKRLACRQSPKHLWSVGNLHLRLPTGLDQIQSKRKSDDDKVATFEVPH